MADQKQENKQAAPVKRTEPRTKLPTLEELLKAGSHFGHKGSAWHPKMQQYIHSERAGVHIIDLVKTLQLMKKALLEIEEASEKGQVLVVGTKGQAASVVQKMAEEKGAFYVNKRWPGGLFTNFKAIKKSVDKLVKMEETLASGAKGMVKKEQLLMERDVERLNKLYSGIKFMERLPSLILVIDSKVEKNAIKEARLAGIPSAALIDTNCDPELVNLPIPANDDSIKSITLFVDLFGQAVAQGSKSAALLTMRKEHEEKLKKMKAAFDAEQERVRVMQEQEREMLKAMREGREYKAAAGVSSSGLYRVVEDKEGVVSSKPASVPLSDSGLNTRTVNALNKAGYNNVEDLKGLEKKDLKKIEGVGEKAVEDILKLIK
jgi:small subunit ribosomal protein S2